MARIDEKEFNKIVNYDKEKVNFSLIDTNKE
jgi:hypothetical protein